MIVAMLPGMFRTAAQIQHWKDRLPAQVQAFDLPGFGNEPFLHKPTLAKLADLYCQRLPANALVIGESLGGLVALEMARRGFRAVAIDPPLATHKLWVLPPVLRQAARRHPNAAWLWEFLDVFFGVMADGRQEPRNYWPLLDAIPHRVDIIAATLPMWPVRQIQLVQENTPSVLDDTDAYHLSRRPIVRFQQVEGPHTLLTEAVEAMRPLLVDIITSPRALEA